VECHEQTSTAVQQRPDRERRGEGFQGANRGRPVREDRRRLSPDNVLGQGRNTIEFDCSRSDIQL
jgi:hypothetical protein